MVLETASPATAISLRNKTKHSLAFRIACFLYLGFSYRNETEARDLCTHLQRYKRPEEKLTVLCVERIDDI
jgi:hypothetical protein